MTGWTVDTLKYHVDARFDEFARRMDERHTTQQEEIKSGDALSESHFGIRLNDIATATETRQAMLDERFVSQTTALQAALESASRAVDKARDSDLLAVDKALDAAEKAVDKRQDTSDKEFHEHLEQVRHSHLLAFVNSEKATEAALGAQKDAVWKAELSNEKRFEQIAGSLAQQNDLSAGFTTRMESAAVSQRYDERINDLQTRLDKAEGNLGGSKAAFGQMLALGGVAMTLVIFLINYFTS